MLVVVILSILVITLYLRRNRIDASLLLMHEFIDYYIIGTNFSIEISFLVI